MKTKLLVIIFLIIFTLSISGCGIIQKIQDQIDIANSFADFAPGFSDVLEGSDNLPHNAQDSLASQVSMEIEIGPENNNSSSDISISDEVFSVHIKIENVSKSDFITFLTATAKEDVPVALQDEWDEYDKLRSQDISNISIFADGTPLDEDISFDRDTINDIRGIIDVGNNIATLQAQLEMDINTVTYAGYLKAGFIKSNDDWKIEAIEIKLQPQN